MFSVCMRSLRLVAAVVISIGPGIVQPAEVQAYDSVQRATPVTTYAAFGVDVFDLADPVQPGDELSYVLVVQNNGPSDAQAVVLRDPIPNDTTFLSFTQDTGPAFFLTTLPVGTAGPAAVGATIGTLAVGATATFTLVVRVDQGTADGTFIVNTVTVDSATGCSPSPTVLCGSLAVGERPIHRSDTELTIVSAPSAQPAGALLPSGADLAVTMSENRSPYTVTAGKTFREGSFTYFISLRNDGPGQAQNVKLTDALPDHTTFIAFTQTGGPAFALTAPPVGSTGTATATIAVLPSAASASFELMVEVDANTPEGSVLVNRATVASDTLDPASINNSATTTTRVHAVGRLVIAITDAPDPVMPGSDLTYVLRLSNSGPSDAQNVELSDEIPANTAFVSFRQDTGPAFVLTMPVGGPGVATASVTATIGTLAAGATATFTLLVNVDPSTGDGAQISNTAKATSTTQMAVYPPGYNPVTVTTRVSIFAADLAVDVSDAPDPVEAGGLLRYSITVVNSGPDSATGVSLADYISYQTTLVSWSQNSGPDFALSACCDYGAPRAEGGTLAAGESATFTLVVRVDTDASADTVLENTASVSSNAADPSPGNGQAVATTVVIAAPPTN